MKNSRPALLFLLVFIAFLLAPILIVCWVAFTPEAYLSVPWGSFSLRWFEAVLHDTRFIEAFWFSCALGAASATASSLLALPAAFALARYEFPGRGAINGFLLSPLLIPHVVLGVALLNFISNMGFSGSFGALFVAHTLLVFPFVLRLITSASAGLDPSLEHAASTLGATRVVVLRRVMVPALAPGLASGWIIAFITSFDELTMSVFLTSPATVTLPVRLYSKMEDGIDPFVTAVSALLVVIATFAMYALDRLFGLERFFLGKAAR